MTRSPAVVVALAAAVLACGKPAPTDAAGGAGSEPEPSTKTPPPPVSVTFSGCAAMPDGPICEITEARRSVSVLVEHGAQPVSFRIGTTDVEAKAPKTFDDGARLLVLEVPHADGTLEVMVGKTRAARLPLVAVTPPAAYAKAYALRKQRKQDEALAALGDLEQLPKAWRGRAQSLLGRIMMGKGDVDAAAAGLNAGMAAHLEAKRWSDAIADGFALVHHHVNGTGDLVAARKVIDDLAPVLKYWPEGRASMGYYEALLRRDSGDLQGAERLLTQSLQRAERLGLDGMANASAWVRGRLLAPLGQREAFARWLDAELKATSAEKYPCARAGLLADKAWNVLMLREQGATALPKWAQEPRPALKERMRLLVRRCKKPQRRVAALTDMALDALQRGDRDAARKHVLAARVFGVAPQAFIAVWLEDIEARLLVADGRPGDAMKKYATLAKRGIAAGLPGVQWRAHVGLGAAAEVANDDVAAQRAYEEAERVLDKELRGVPWGDETAAFLTGRERSGRRLVALLARKGDAAGALRAFRRARVRATLSAQRADRLANLPPKARATWTAAMSRYRGLRKQLAKDAAEDWKLSAEALDAALAKRRSAVAKMDAALEVAFVAARGIPAPTEFRGPADKELVLGLAARDSSTWWVFAQTSQGVSVESVPAGDAGVRQALTKRGLEGLEQLRVIAGAAATDLDVHALELGGGLVIAKVAVAYATDVGDGKPAAGAVSSAVVVADPRGDLPEARAEGKLVASALGQQARLLEGDAATFQAVAQAAQAGALLHFAGHGRYAGADSSLMLAGEQVLRVGDILALKTAPSQVILSGCETARALRSDRVPTLGLAQAFIAAGSTAVVAASRPVPDTTARAYSAALYASLSKHPGDLASSTRLAQQRLRKAQPKADWAAYRLIVP